MRIRLGFFQCDFWRGGMWFRLLGYGVVVRSDAELASDRYRDQTVWRIGRWHAMPLKPDSEKP